MNILIEARQKLAKVLQAREDLLTKLVKEDRAASEEERTTLANLDADMERHETVIAQVEKLRKDKNSYDPGAETEPRGSSTPARVQVTREDGEDENGNYRPFRSLGEQLQLVARGTRNPIAMDKRLVELNKRAIQGMNETAGADGAFLIQDDFSTELFRNATDAGLIAPLCRDFPLSQNSNGMRFPVLNETSRVDGSRWGGIRVYRANEGGSVTKSAPTFSTEQISLEKMLGYVVITDEMLEDAPFLGTWVNDGFKEEFSVQIDNEIITGTGANQMKGVLNADCLVTITKETSQAAATIMGENVLKMAARIFPRGFNNAVWLVNQSCIPQIATLTITKSKSDVPLYTPAGLMNGQIVPAMILGRPVKVVEQAKAVGTKGDIILGDFSRYMIISKGGLKAASSIHVYFESAQTSFRFEARNNGQPMLKKAITPMNGTDTLTDFVVCETRS